MNFAFSPTVGLLVSQCDSSGIPTVRDLNSSATWSDEECLYLLPTIQDWEYFEATPSNLEVVTHDCLSAYRFNRTKSLILCLLEGLSDSLTKEVIEETELLLQAGTSSEAVLNHLLVAPLKDPSGAQALARKSLELGFASVARLLDRLIDLQPLLRRLVAKWLALQPSDFLELNEPREALWTQLSTDSLLTTLLEAKSRASFNSGWARLAFENGGAGIARGVFHLGNRLTDALFPAGKRQDYSDKEEYRFADETDKTFSSSTDSYTEYLRAHKQIEAIVRAVSEGRDAKAERYLRDLIESQRRMPDGDRYLVMSLCNVAQRCSDLFRADFELHCLERALDIAPNDSWTQVQMGNHFKHTGQYDAAFEMLTRAVNSVNSSIALASIADISIEKGDYQEASRVYRSISGWENIASVRVALADLLRKEGHYDRALAEYEAILGAWPDTDRPIAGKAEIAKRLGDYERALQLYDSLLNNPRSKEADRMVYRCAKCSVLKLANRLEEAYDLIDGVVKRTPFNLAARIHRGAILGLLGEAATALESIDRRKVTRAAGTWINQYYEGLLLLKLSRYRTARDKLIAGLQQGILDGDSRIVMRLGAACAVLHEDDLDAAANLLAEIGEVRDYFTKYVYHVLQYHLSVAQRDSIRAKAILADLNSQAINDETVSLALAAIDRSDFHTARRLEVELLLRIAA